MRPSSFDTRTSLLYRLRDEGDLLAWQEVVSIYAPLIRRMARHQGLQPTDAEDVVQEVFLAVYASIDKWLAQEERSGFRRWLLGICRNTSLNAINRKPRGAVGLGGTTGVDELAKVPDLAKELESMFDLECQRQVYQWAAARVRQEVSEKTWLAFHRTHVDGITIEAAAQELGMIAGNVYVARSRVMKRLQTLVREFSSEPAP